MCKCALDRRARQGAPSQTCAQAHTGRVALAASQTVGTYVVPRLLAAFRARNPGVRMHGCVLVYYHA